MLMLCVHVIMHAAFSLFTAYACTLIVNVRIIMCVAEPDRETEAKASSDDFHGQL